MTNHLFSSSSSSEGWFMVTVTQKIQQIVTILLCLQVSFSNCWCVMIESCSLFWLQLCVFAVVLRINCILVKTAGVVPDSSLFWGWHGLDVQRRDGGQKMLNTELRGRRKGSKIFWKSGVMFEVDDKSLTTVNVSNLRQRFCWLTCTGR